MLTDEGLGVIAALNEALEMRKMYLQGLLEKVHLLPNDAKEELKALLEELNEFDASFSNMLFPVVKEKSA